MSAMNAETQHVAAEYCFLKVPHECLNREFRRVQRATEKELLLVQNTVAQLVSNSALTGDEVKARLDPLIARLDALQREIAASDELEATFLDRCSARVTHLRGMKASLSRDTPDMVEQHRWKRQRVDRFVAEYMLRRGMQRSSQALVDDAGLSPFVDGEVFALEREVCEALLAHDCGPALAYCAANKSNLRKMQSPLEFAIRLQQFVELLRVGDKLGAIKHSQQHLAPFADAHRAALLTAVGCLAFRDPANCGVEAYRELFAPQRWEQLADTFRQENRRMHSIPNHSMLELTLQAGVVALKTRQCGTEADRSEQCPCCDQHVRDAAQHLPYAKHEHSSLVCGITGETMDENNPPLALPNGQVYSRKGLEAAARESGGTVRCPRTGDEFPLTLAKRVFVL